MSAIIRFFTTLDQKIWLAAMAGTAAVSGAMFLLWLRSKEKPESPETIERRECWNYREDANKARDKGEYGECKLWHERYVACQKNREMSPAETTEKFCRSPKELPELINKDKPYPYI